MSAYACPQCNKRGVTLRLGREDWYRCRYCDWTACNQGEDAVDVAARRELAHANPAADIWVTDVPGDQTPASEGSNEMIDSFWDAIEAQLAQLRTARTADDVVRILASPGCVGDAFFGGSGGDGSVEDALSNAGWTSVWRDAHYYWVMRAPNGDKITYVEGDIYKGDQALKGPSS